MTPRRLVMLVGLLGVGCDGELFAIEQVDEKWCTSYWMCNINSGAVATPGSDGQCAEGLVPAICLYYGDRDATDEEVYCHHPELFADACSYEVVCRWDEEADYYVVECS